MQSLSEGGYPIISILLMRMPLRVNSMLSCCEKRNGLHCTVPHQVTLKTFFLFISTRVLLIQSKSFLFHIPKLFSNLLPLANYIGNLDFNPRGELVATASIGSEFLISDVTTNTCFYRLEINHNGNIQV